ncbi:DUF3299 domain-containing protein [Luteibaculum oceani]|uniref:DUF3299 domain-containing protein n=1 Tax=Luteibaculum oceani TaxID=1294296 RepID=A0A5C6UY88_9FLAO|nr:DUF3299 domain-containing protein [Luteibaculum oceani]TXC78463.1 DUF3299 domain-containing protein [Luteibaculum oceani]
MKYFLVLLLSFFSYLNIVSAQQQIDWKILSDVTFEERYSDELASYIMIPTFGEKVKQLEGKLVKIKGYVIPLDVKMNQYVLSANPFASCFFCGNAGPETVMDIVFKAQENLRTDQYMEIEGVLELNKNDVYRLNYILMEAVINN